MYNIWCHFLNRRDWEVLVSGGWPPLDSAVALTKVATLNRTSTLLRSSLAREDRSFVVSTGDGSALGQGLTVFIVPVVPSTSANGSCDSSLSFYSFRLFFISFIK